MKNWFNYKGTISGKTYLFRSLLAGIPLLIVYALLIETNYYAGSVFYFFVLLTLFSFRYKRMSAVFKNKIDFGKKLFYITTSIELLIAVYYLFDVELGQSEDVTPIDLLELPSAIFVSFILFKDSGIEKHNG